MGSQGESIAAAFLQARGYVVRERNYHCRGGEIDLVCSEGPVLVFCEVKLRRGDAFGSPEEAVTRRKLDRLVHAAQTYLVAHGLEDADWRIDLVAIELDARGVVARTDLYQAIGS